MSPEKLAETVSAQAPYEQTCALKITRIPRHAVADLGYWSLHWKVNLRRISAASGCEHGFPT